MRYDLGDCTLWEYMFLSNEKPQLQIPEDDILDGLDEDEVRCSSIICIFYHPQIRLWEGNVFTGICLFMERVTSNELWGRSHGRVPLPQEMVGRLPPTP